MYAFDYQRPATLADALALLNEDTKALAGGQTYLPTLRQRLAMPEAVIDLADIQELRGICPHDRGIAIGAMTRHADVANHSEIRKHLPGLAQLAGGIGDPAVRNRGTLGGSLANNDPAACYPAAVLALDAQIKTSKRQLSADDFFQGLFTTALDDDELILSVDFPLWPCAYYKFKQPASRFALAGVFIARTPEGRHRVAVTGAGQDGVFRWEEAEAALDADPKHQDFASLALRPEMNQDIHADAAYRANLVAVCCKRAAAQL